jgi:hypothetical protein
VSNSAAGLGHMADVGPMMKPLSDVCTITITAAVEVCGKPGPEVDALTDLPASAERARKR